MCGRFGLMVSWQDIQDFVSILKNIDAVVDMPPRYNIAPTQPIATIVTGPTGEREGILARWGFVPSWVKDPKEFTLIINARSETAAEKPSFKNAMRHRRVLIPASGFYEWQRYGKGKGSQPYWVRPREGNVVAFGGLMETWAGSDGSEVDTVCILSTAANESFSEIHHRLPTVIQPEDFDQWLDCKTREPRDVEHLLAPVKDDFFEVVPVSDAVNKVANADASIQEPVAPKKHPTEEKNTDNQMSLF